MIIIYHIKAKKQVEVCLDNQILDVFPTSLVDAFWEVCERYPEQLIIWQDRSLNIEISDDLEDAFPHSHIMASYPLNNYYIPDSIGYVDQLPFVNPDKNVRYPTWLMSTDVGGVYGEVALKFKPHFKKTRNFGYLINSIAKLGQQNSLFCYSDPSFSKKGKITLRQAQCDKNSNTVITQTGDVFCFIAQHYKKVRLFILLFCYIKYERRFPILSFLKALYQKSFFQLDIELPELENIVDDDYVSDSSIDVIIPTLGRPQHLKNVLIDLRNQNKKPEKVIIVEQNLDVNSTTALEFLKSENWPFEIVHHFIHVLGACNARNRALKEVRSEWVFFADDDIRIPQDLLKNTLVELKTLKVNSINFNCLNPGGSTVFQKIKQWGSFGSGSSIVKSQSARQCHYREIYEHGYGEDADFGMQLRKIGNDIVYHPNLIITHLKAPIGGLRNRSRREWEEDAILPKPSPTLMAYYLRYFNLEEIRGFKINLLLKFYKKQPIRNPLAYYSKMNKRWDQSMLWAERLMEQDKT